MIVPQPCPFCGQAHPDGVRFCPVTGRPLPAAPVRARQSWTWLWVLVGALGLGILALGVYWLRSEGLPALRELYTSAGRPDPISTQSETAAPPASPSVTQTNSAATPTSTALLEVAGSGTPIEAAAGSPGGSTTATPTDTAPALSGELSGSIAYTCQIFRDQNRNQICIVQADGSNWYRLTTRNQADHNYPAFSPDGKAVVYSGNYAGSYDLFEIGIDGDGERQITDLPGDEYSPAVSPDGLWVAFTYNDGAHQTIWITDRSGGNPRPLTNGEEREAWDPTWSPDGSRILFASGPISDIQLFIMNSDGTGIQKVTEIGDLRGRSDWSPDGQYISTYQGAPWSRELILLDLTGQILATLTEGGNNLAPNFSPYGGWIAFTSYRDHFRDDHGCEIYVMRQDGSEFIRLTENDYCDWQPSWGP